ncbi:anthrone oxygenase family protein [Spirillospora sp. CA-294931]|uniref:anthrone oxygenase family protein n=1 Tax=Spirillospora sp. CA-294931 TaxID=3240042 RepID=UPI003D8F3EB0
MLVNTLSLLVLVGSGTVAGTLFAVARAVVPTMVALPGNRYVQVHQLLDRRFDPLLPWVTRVTMATALVLAFLSVSTTSRVLIGAGLAMSVMLAVISDTRNVPINKRIADWDPENAPAEWDELRGRWCRANTVRTVFALGAFVSYSLAAMLV